MHMTSANNLPFSNESIVHTLVLLYKKTLFFLATMRGDPRLSVLIWIVGVFTCCFLNVQSEEEEGRKVSFNAEQTAKLQRAKAKLLAVTAIAEETATAPQSSYFQRKLNAAKTKVEKIEKKLLGESDAEGKAERISGALSGVGEGLIGIIQGYQDGDWVQAVQGALGNSIFY